MIHHFKEFLYFTKSEKRGVLALSVLLILSFFLPGLITRFSFSAGDLDPDQWEEQYVYYVSDWDSANRDQYFHKKKPITGWKKYQHNTSGKYAGIMEYQSDNLKKIHIIELNAADSLDLLSVNGIGPYLSHKILVYRMRLGGFYETRQLMEIKGIDRERYSRIRNYFRVDTLSIKKICINTADFKVIMRHPYADYLIAKAWIKFRQQFGVMTEVDDLRKGGILPDSTFIKIRPYLSVD